MMAKITKGSVFAGAIKYIFDPEKQTELLAAEGVRLKNVESVARSFEAQRQLNTRVTRPVGHISLDFSAQDRQWLDNTTMVAIAREYMERMGIRDTQFIIGRHHDREHPHIHLLYNRVDNNGRTISDQHDRTRSTKICRELTEKHGLYISSGKENVKRQRYESPMQQSTASMMHWYDTFRSLGRGTNCKTDSKQRGSKSASRRKALLLRSKAYDSQ